MDDTSPQYSVPELVADFTVWVLLKYLQACDWLDDAGNDWLHR